MVYTYACYLSIAKSGIGLPFPFGRFFFSFGISPGSLSSKSDELLVASRTPQKVRILVNFRVDHFQFFLEHSVDISLVLGLF